MIIERDFDRPLNDDFQLRVSGLMSRLDEALPLYVGGLLVGWKIVGAYE